MFNIFLITQFAITLLILLSVLIQKIGKQSFGGLDSSNNTSVDNNFIVKTTWILIFLFFCNSIILANIASKNSKYKNIVKIESIENDEIKQKQSKAKSLLNPNIR